MKRSVSVQIAGQKYSLRSDADDQTVKEIAAFVDSRIKDIHKQTRTADTQAAAILAALQIAEDLFKERQAGKDLKSKIREKGKLLLHFLEREARV
jgi:cell division protein ZapA